MLTFASRLVDEFPITVENFSRCLAFAIRTISRLHTRIAHEWFNYALPEAVLLLQCIRTAVGDAPEPQIPLRIHYARTIPAARSAPDSNLGSIGPELHHGKVSIRRSYYSSYICISVVYGPSHVMLRLGPPCTRWFPFSFRFTF